MLDSSSNVSYISEIFNVLDSSSNVPYISEIIIEKIVLTMRLIVEFTARLVDWRVSFFPLNFAQKRAGKKNARDYPLQEKIINFTATTMDSLGGVSSFSWPPTKSIAMQQRSNGSNQGTTSVIMSGS